MPILIVNNTSYAYPDPGTEPGWGESATAWAQGVTDVLATLLAPGDILQSSYVINNAVASPININGLAFNGAVTRAANVQYAIYRISTANPAGNAEQGTLYLTYDSAASSGNKWILASQNSGSNSGVIFSITDSGQVQYISTDINSVGYSGTIKFSAKTLGV